MVDGFTHTAGWNRRGFRGVAAGRAFYFERKGTEGFHDVGAVRCGMASKPGGNIDSHVLPALVGFLMQQRDSREAGEALSALRDGLLAPGCIELLVEQPDLGQGHIPFYVEGLVSAGMRVAIARRYPSLSKMLQCIWAVDPGMSDEDPETLVRQLLRRYAPHATPGSIKGVLSYERTIQTKIVLGALLGTPVERHPRGPKDCDSFEMVVAASSNIGGLLGGHGHLASARHGWTAFAATLARCLPAGEPPDRTGTVAKLHAACGDAVDLSTTFSRQVLLPVLSGGGVADERTLLRFADVRVTGTLRNQTGATRMAARMLFGGKSLPAILELSGQWHRRQHAMDDRIRRITPPLPGDPEPRLNAWPVPFAPLKTSNGLSIVFLGDTGQLVDEGGALDSLGVPGMRHCVGGYTSQCASGRSAIASVRSEEGGSFRRLSTVEVQVERDGLQVVQNRGVENGSPPGAAKDAVAWLVKEVREGRLRPAPDYMHQGWRTGQTQSLMHVCGYDHAAAGAVDAAIEVWSPLLVRPMRGRVPLLAVASGLFLEIVGGERLTNPGPTGWQLAARIALGIGVAFLAMPMFVAELVGMWSLGDLESEEVTPPVVITAFLVEAAFLAGIAQGSVYLAILILAAQVAVLAWSEARSGFALSRLTRVAVRNVRRAWRLNEALKLRDGASGDTCGLGGASAR